MVSISEYTIGLFWGGGEHNSFWGHRVDIEQLPVDFTWCSPIDDSNFIDIVLDPKAPVESPPSTLCY